MRESLNTCFAKVQRATEHLEHLKAERLRCLSDTFVKAETTEEGEHFVARVVFPAALPPRLSNIVGDIVHNLRSALDHLACSIVRASGSKVTTSTQFPVFDAADKFEEQISRYLPGANQPLIEAVREFQPYHRDPPAHDMLRVIHRLDIEDKHRGLLVAAVLPNRVEFEARGRKDSLFDLTLNDRISFPLSQGAELLRFRLRQGVSLNNLELKISLGADLALVEAEPVHGQPIVDVCHSASEYVLKSVLARFVPLIEASAGASRSSGLGPHRL